MSPQRRCKPERTPFRGRRLPLLLTFVVGGMGCLGSQALQAVLMDPTVPLTDARVAAFVFGLGAAGRGLWGSATWSATNNAWLSNAVAAVMGMLLGK